MLAAYSNDRKAYMRAYQKQWVARRRADYFIDKRCNKCDSTERLELDHIDPSTKVSSAIWSWSESKRLAELEKCQVLCNLCHLDKTKHDLSVMNRFSPVGLQWCSGHQASHDPSAFSPGTKRRGYCREWRNMRKKLGLSY